MPLPETIHRRVEQLLFAFRQLRVPDGARDHYRLEFRVRANAVTLYECHGPWRPGQPWSRMPSAQFRFDPVQLAWTSTGLIVTVGGISMMTPHPHLTSRIFWSR